MRPTTKLIHNTAMTETQFGEASPAIYRASTFQQDPNANQAPFVYSRMKNPTRSALEAVMADLEEGATGFAFSSGMAAIAAVLNLLDSGDHLIVPRDLYGGTDQILRELVGRQQLSVSYVDMTSPEDIRAHVTPKTRAIYVETPSNPTLRITDLRAVVGLAQEHHLMTIADNTFMSPYLQRPLAMGIDVAIHSATKFLGGHSDVTAGVAVARDAKVGEALAKIQSMYGGILGPDDSWMVIRGIKTLGVRLDRAQNNAHALAQFLAGREEVAQVYFPGIPDHPGFALHQSQAEGPGAVLSFTLVPEISVRDFVGALRYALYGVSLGGVETIVSHPETMSHAAMDPQVRESIGITSQLLRVSVGIEDIEDLVADFQNALDQGRRHRVL